MKKTYQKSLSHGCLEPGDLDRLRSTDGVVLRVLGDGVVAVVFGYFEEGQDLVEAPTCKEFISTFVKRANMGGFWTTVQTRAPGPCFF